MEIRSPRLLSTCLKRWGEGEYTSFPTTSMEEGIRDEVKDQTEFCL